MVACVDRPPTLTATVADSIREGIFRGELHPGKPLREVELAEALDVSRGTVREALRQIQDESLVEVIPHRGAFVTNLTPKMADELHTIRALIEPLAGPPRRRALPGLHDGDRQVARGLLTAVPTLHRDASGLGARARPRSPLPSDGQNGFGRHPAVW